MGELSQNYARQIVDKIKQFDEKVDSIDFTMTVVPESKESQIQQLSQELGLLKQSVDELLR